MKNCYLHYKIQNLNFVMEITIFHTDLNFVTPKISMKNCYLHHISCDGHSKSAFRWNFVLCTENEMELEICQMEPVKFR